VRRRRLAREPDRLGGRLAGRGDDQGVRPGGPQVGELRVDGRVGVGVPLRRDELHFGVLDRRLEAFEELCPKSVLM
jgi:hypothetical protein